MYSKILFDAVKIAFYSFEKNVVFKLQEKSDGINHVWKIVASIPLQFDFHTFYA